MSNVIAGNCHRRSIGNLRPGEWQIRMVNWKKSRGKVGPYLFFACPNKKGPCGVPIKPSPPNRLGFVWTWNQLKKLASLTPSIHCTTEHGGCGFHGFLTNGVIA